jgi:hypothetical protein
MSDTVVDSSVAAKWILPEPDSAQADRLIAEVALKGETSSGGWQRLGRRDQDHWGPPR